MEDLEAPAAGSNGETTVSHNLIVFSDEFDSSCSTPYVSAPSSPGRRGGDGGPSPPSFRFFYSAPTSPMHFLLTSSSLNSPPSHVTSEPSHVSGAGSSEFEFSARSPATGSAFSGGSMSSADELFVDGKIRPKILAPLIDVDDETAAIDCDNAVTESEKEAAARGRDSELRDRSIRRRTRSMSPLRTTSFEWCKSHDQSSNDQIEQRGLSFESKQINEEASDEAISASASSSRSSSVGRSSKRWVFLKDLLYRSKSEGQGRNNNNNNHKYFWSSISFTPIKDRKLSTTPSSSSDSINTSPATTTESAKKVVKQSAGGGEPNRKPPPVAGKVMNGIGKRPVSAHELHYTANRAQAEEMRKKTFLPYRQGLFGFLGFSSKSSNGGAMNHHGYVARPLNPVSSSK